jgi:hypothetical protein
MHIRNNEETANNQGTVFVTKLMPSHEQSLYIIGKL